MAARIFRKPVQNYNNKLNRHQNSTFVGIFRHSIYAVAGVFIVHERQTLFFLPFGDGFVLFRFANYFYLRICVGIKFVRANALNLKKYEIT